MPPRLPGHRRRRRVGAVLCVLAVAASACSSARPVAAPPARPHSIVQLGDSVAAGEGTLYGYHYDPATRSWVGGNLNVTWPGLWPLCHDSPFAYGDVLARALQARFTQLACTGADFAHGVVGPKIKYDKTVFATTATLAQPAQFGNWKTGQHLNPRYQQARPDLVLITLGADDVTFTSIIKACVENALLRRIDPATQLECTSADPGGAVRQDFFDRLSTLRANYVTLAHWILDRGKSVHRVPKVVFTTYYDPLPQNGASCPDSELLDPAQIRYLTARLVQLNHLILDTIGGLHNPDVTTANLINAFDGHQWCSDQPWVYGLSIFSLTHPSSLLSQAPFHPTAAGQRQIARVVGGVVKRVFHHH